MAIEQNLLKTSDNNHYGHDFSNVYYKIDMLRIDAIEEKITIGVRGYAEAYARENDRMGIYKKIIDINFDEINITEFTIDKIKTACYEYLKTLDEFKAGKDV